ncbi:MAG TPA: lysine-sensitive aspartokinase 3 [Acidobacteriota bacterium]|nr:lysine-sensitive aspartokinase 3 [Acidobacteriota bacterium]
MIVCKFGGTSVQDAAAVERVVGIVRRRLKEKPVVVASAMGKTTNQLLQAAQIAAKGSRSEALNLVNKIKEKHLQEAEKLGLTSGGNNLTDTVNGHFKEICNIVGGLSALGELTPRSMDAMASFGERLSTLILTEALVRRDVPAQLMDARQCIITDDNFTRAAPLFDLTDGAIRAHLIPAVKDGRVPVLQGFIGSTRAGITSTIGRGGSDYSAAIVGAALDAYDIQIWTDVDGIMTTDPRMVPEARRVRVISFDEAAELAYFGARVLHPATILPAVRRQIPVHVLNSYRPDQEGTLITGEAPPCENPVKAIAYKKGITIINITSTRMLMAHGFLRRIFETFDFHKAAVDVVSTSEVSVSLTLDETSALWDIVTELKKIGEVRVDGGKAIVCCVGDNLRNIPGVALTVFSAVQDVNVHMISQGASAINITFVVDEDRLPRVIRSLHDVFFQKPDPLIFE